MGYPLTSYKILRDLADERDTESNVAARRALRPFNLFAFIIHDPEAHARFHSVLERRFGWFDYMTSHRLLFFALVDPPEGWQRHARNRHYTGFLRNLEPEAHMLLNPSNAPVSDDKSITAFSIANALGIPTDELPCIVVTQGFHLKCFRWFRTTHDQVEEQLFRLRYFAERFEKPMPEFQRDWNEIEREIDLCSGHGEETLIKSLAEVLSDVLSFIVDGKDPRAHDQVRSAIEQLYKNIYRLKQELRLNQDTDEGVSEELDRLYICLASFLAHLNKRQHLSLDEFLPIKREWLEADSFVTLRTAHKVYNLLVDPQPDGRILHGEYEDIDFSPGVICLAKVFEKEANLSVVHWARKVKNVKLPEFFNRRQPHLKAIIVPNIPNGHEIDLNMGHQGKWLPPGIGQSELACKELSKQGLDKRWDQQSWNTLLDLWQKVREKRNKAAHTEPIDKASLDAVKEALQQMTQNQVFEKFWRMKKEYRGEF